MLGVAGGAVVDDAVLICVEEFVFDRGENGPPAVFRLYANVAIALFLVEVLLILLVIHRILDAQLGGAVLAKPAVHELRSTGFGDGAEGRVFHDGSATWANEFFRACLIHFRHDGLLSLENGAMW